MYGLQLRQCNKNMVLYFVAQKYQYQYQYQYMSTENVTFKTTYLISATNDDMLIASRFRKILTVFRITWTST